MCDTIPPEPAESPEGIHVAQTSPAPAPTASVCDPSAAVPQPKSRTPPPLPSAQPIVDVVQPAENQQESTQKEETSVSPSEGVAISVTSMEDVMRSFVDYEKSLTVPDVIKRFYQIRLEQEALRGEPEYCSMAACNPIHCARNRYRDILPYDHNRVVLESGDDNPDGYMNASHVCLAGGATRFIASQAPLPTTLDEWWQMVDEHQVTLVVMLCRLVEMSKVKCERYWPTEKGTKEIFGNYEITLNDECTFAEDDEYVLRTLTMHNQETGEERSIQQLHYREWPDHGCPSGERQLLNMIDKMAELHTDKQRPVLVHCSAGVGRTGTIIAVNYVRELMEAGTLSELDMFQLVMNLRKQRASMVQTQDQYQFVHKCVAFYCRRRLGLPQPPQLPPKPVLSPVRAFIAAGSPIAVAEESSDIDDMEGTVVPDFPHEPPAPRGPEELGSAAS